MKYQCPCCGYFTFPTPPENDIGYICPVCFWESDKFIHSEEEKSACNHGLTLARARDNFRQVGACEAAMVKNVRPPKEDEVVNGLIIGASSEALHTLEMAHRHGIHVTALDGDPEAEGLKAADRAMVVNISDEEKAIEAAREATPEFVLTVPIGRYLTTVGAVNDALGLPGISREMAVLCTDKYAFHQRLSSQGLRMCKCYKVWTDEQEVCLISGEGKRYSAAELEAAPENVIKEMVPFPAILKPRYGSGSRGIYFLNDKQQLLEALPAVAGEDYVLEECAIGDEYGVDGAVADGKFYLVLLRKKENTPPPARQAVGYYSVQPADSFYQQVREHLEKVVSCLGLQECLFHADLIRSEKGPFVIELSARPSGHNLHNLFTPLCTGVDMAEEYMKYRQGQPYSFVPKETKAMLIHYFDMEGQVSHVPDRAEAFLAAGGLLVEWKCNMKVGDVLAPVSDGHSVMGRGYFVLKAARNDSKENPVDYTEELKKKAEAVKSLFF